MYMYVLNGMLYRDFRTCQPSTGRVRERFPEEAGLDETWRVDRSHTESRPLLVPPPHATGQCVRYSVGIGSYLFNNTLVEWNYPFVLQMMKLRFGEFT